MKISWCELDDPQVADRFALQPSSLPRRRSTSAPAPVSHTPVDNLRAAQRLAREAFTQLATDAVHNAGSIATARPADDHRMLEEAVKGSAQLASTSQAVQAMAIARYAAIDEELVDSDTAVTAKVEHALGH